MDGGGNHSDQGNRRGKADVYKMIISVGAVAHCQGLQIPCRDVGSTDIFWCLLQDAHRPRKEQNRRRPGSHMTADATRHGVDGRLKGSGHTG